MGEPQADVCLMCGHPLTEHQSPVEGRPYWRCTHWVGHPFDGPCGCRERHLLAALTTAKEADRG